MGLNYHTRSIAREELRGAGQDFELAPVNIDLDEIWSEPLSRNVIKRDVRSAGSDPLLDDLDLPGEARIACHVLPQSHHGFRVRLERNDLGASEIGQHQRVVPEGPA